MTDKNTVELLSPARDCNVARAAILAGADAVYIGASRFGARGAAANEESDIASLCKFAHLYDCKVYVALNTILTDAELVDAARLTYRLKDAGVDALIVQDFGLLACDIAQIPIHASTQCDIRTPEKAKLMETLGFETIVLARELSLAEISAIRNAVSSRLECFVHGALCVSYSGQCYLSYAVGRRSGNRGECAQPCRLKYELFDADGNSLGNPAYYLSLRDMNRSNSVGEMLDSGVRSFKIEGRLKDESYVKNITAYYRRALDAAMRKRGLTRQSCGDTVAAFDPNPQKTFNRGFTEYHLHGTQKNCGSFATPKSRGEFFGPIRKSFRNGFYYTDAAQKFVNGDGLLFETSDGIYGAAIRKIEGDKIWVGHPEDDIFIEEGCNLWRNFNAKFERELKPEPLRKMPVSISLNEDGGGWKISMKLKDARAISDSVYVAKKDVELAKNAELAKIKIGENISKLGASVFVCNCEDVKIDAQSLPFLPPAKVNELRRELAESLEGKILAAYAEKQSHCGRNPLPEFPLPQELTTCIKRDYRANVLNRKAFDFYAAMGVEISEYSSESGKVDLRGKELMRTKHCILRELGLCKKTSQKIIKEPLELRADTFSLNVYTDCAKCENILRQFGEA